MTDLDPIQNQAVERAMAVVRNGGSFKLLGKAGTGKTTTGLAIVDAIIESGRKVICCAFTNKAVNRMVEVGYPAQYCRTIHRLLYQTGIVIQIGDHGFQERDADFILRHDRENPEHRAKVMTILQKANVEKDRWKTVVELIQKGKGDRVPGLTEKTEEQLAKEGIGLDTVIVVDELSMVPLDDADTLHNTFKSVIFIGDPGQLPPVSSVDTCKYLGCDDQVELQTIHRVRGNAYLLDLIYALDAGRIPPGSEAITIEAFQSMARSGYQFICYTNNGVAWINEETRRALGVFGALREGEPLITVTRTRASRTVAIDDRNIGWFLANEKRLTGQYTGSQGRSGAVYNRTGQSDADLESVTLVRTIQKNAILACAGAPSKTESDLWSVPVTIENDPKVWLVKTVPFWDMSLARKKAFRRVGSSMSLDFSYAITAHKSQGSQWPKVAVMLRQIYRRDMGNTEILDEVKRWNYTAATRGQEDIQLFTSIIGCPHG